MMRGANHLLARVKSCCNRAKMAFSADFESDHYFEALSSSLIHLKLASVLVLLFRCKAKLVVCV